MGQRRFAAAGSADFHTIWTLAWPQILMMFLTFLIGFVDVYVGGRLDREPRRSSAS